MQVIVALVTIVLPFLPLFAFFNLDFLRFFRSVVVETRFAVGNSALENLGFDLNTRNLLPAEKTRSGLEGAMALQDTRDACLSF